MPRPVLTSAFPISVPPEVRGEPDCGPGGDRVLLAPVRPGMPEYTNFIAVHEAAPRTVLVIDGKGMHRRFGR